MLEVRKLTFGYEEEPVINNISLKVSEKEIVLIEGDNGVGKTTLLKCIAGILNNGKKIYIDGVEVYDNKKALKKISFVMSDDFLYDYLTVDENILFFKNMFDESEEYEKKVQEYYEKFEICKYKNVLVKNLSQGTRNKVYLAVMLSKKHNILILDEPFTALDSEMQAAILDIVTAYKKEDNKCVIMVTHIEEFKQIATRKYKLKKT